MDVRGEKRADKWGDRLSELQCYLEVALYTRLLCRWWRQVTIREGGKRRKTGVQSWGSKRQHDRHKGIERVEKTRKKWGCKLMDAWFVRHVMCDNSSFQLFSFSYLQLSPRHESMLSRHTQSEVISAGLEANKVNFTLCGVEGNPFLTTLRMWNYYPGKQKNKNKRISNNKKKCDLQTMSISEYKHPFLLQLCGILIKWRPQQPYTASVIKLVFLYRTWQIHRAVCVTVQLSTRL